MANRDILHLAGTVHRDVVHLRQLIYGGALQRMADAEGGLSAARLDGLGGGNGSHADGTAALALRTGDLATTHRAELASALQAAVGALDVALAAVALYPPPRQADAADRAALDRLNGRDPCCENCALTARPDGQRRWVPIDSRATEATTVGGRLPQAVMLCVWCTDKVRAWSRLPTPAEVELHHADQRVPWPDDVERSA